jgi:predicted GNAT family N-acyltransferase
MSLTLCLGSVLVEGSSSRAIVDHHHIRTVRPRVARQNRMSKVTIGVTRADWARDQAVLSSVRFAVFVREQGVPEEIELDGLDAESERVIHAIAKTPSGEVVGTGRMILESPTPRIGRMAVLRSWRSQGVGKAILDFLCAQAADLGYRQVRLHSQSHATPFYYKQGFLSHGAEFSEAGIPHLEMRKALP